MNKKNISSIALCGIGIAIVFALTAFVALPIGQFGYVNLGDSGIMLFATMLSPAHAFLVGGISSAIADLYLGYTHYAMFTLLIKGLEGFVIASIFKHASEKLQPITFIIGMGIMVLGYYLIDAILYGGFIVAISGVGFNLTQGIISVAVATSLYTLLKKVLPNKK